MDHVRSATQSISKGIEKEHSFFYISSYSAPNLSCEKYNSYHDIKQRQLINNKGCLNVEKHLCSTAFWYL